MARLTWSPLALADWQAIVATIANDSPMYARKFGEKLRQAPKRLRRFPLSGWVVAEFGMPTLREILVSPYRIIYRVKPGNVEVVAIVHGSRELKSWLAVDRGDEPE